MQKPIIEIKRANERFTQVFIHAGILTVTEWGIKVAENQESPAADQSKAGPLTNTGKL